MSLVPTKVHWDIRRNGRAWNSQEAMPRYLLSPRKVEMVDGKLLDRVEDRETLLCLLLENIGADKAVQFGNPQVWRDAAAQLKA